MMKNGNSESVWAEINLDSLNENIGFARSSLPGGTQIMAVVKANAYGHGAVGIAKYLERQGIEWLAVFSVEEGVELRTHGVKAPILILESPSLQSLDQVVRFGLTSTIYDIQTATVLNTMASIAARKVKIHVRVDTGLSGAGVQPEEAASLLDLISDLDCLECEGVFTHFNAAYGDDWHMAASQVELFDKVLSTIRGSVPLIHAASSPALLRIPNSAYNMVRLGIMLYGISCQNESVDPYIKPVMQLKSRILSIKPVSADDRMGYGWAVAAHNITKVASIGIGYSHALFLYFLKEGEVLINGMKVPIVSRAAMNHLLVDVSHINDVHIGDEVVIMGEQGSESITAAEIAARAGIGRDNYDVVCLINNAVQKIYIENGSLIKTQSVNA